MMNENEKVVSEVDPTENVTPPKKHKKIDIVAFVLSLVIALSIWIYVVNTTQTEITRTITLEVDVSGQIYEATGMTIFSNTEGTDYSNYQMTITVKGMKNVLDKYDADDYEVEIRTSDIQGGAVQTVTFDVVMPSDEITLDAAPRLDSIYIDKEAQKTLLAEGEGEAQIIVSYKNANLGKNASIVATPVTKSLVITGPERTVNKIAKAEITADILGISTSKQFTSNDIKFLDASGNPIVTTYVALGTPSVEIDLRIYDEREFDVSFLPNSTVDGGYIYELTIVEGAKIVLKGDTALMPPEGGSFVVEFDKKKMTEVVAGTVKISDIKLAEGLELGEGMNDAEISYAIKKSIMADGEVSGENS